MKNIKLPSNLYEKISTIKKNIKILSQVFGRKPSEEELAESMQITIENLRALIKMDSFLYENNFLS